MLKKISIVSIGFLLAPIMALAVNDAQISGTTNFSFLTSDTASPGIIFATSGQFTNIDVNSNYADVTLDNSSDVTFVASTSGVYFKVTKISGSNSYSVSSPSCPTTTINLSGSGATSVVRLELLTTYSCVISTSSTSTPPASPVNAGVGGIVVTPTILNFTATQNLNNAMLSWNNPNSVDFGSVKIVRSDTFFPANPVDGFLVYSGTGESAIDFNLSYGKTYYYSAFSYNRNGNLSNALITKIYLVPPSGTTSTIPISSPSSTVPVFPIYPVSGTGTTTVPSGAGGQASTTSSASSTTSYPSFVFTQQSSNLKISSSTITVDAKTPLIITTDASKMPAGIKSIVLTVVDAADSSKTFSYLFNNDIKGKTFQAVIQNFPKDTLYSFYITGYNSKNEPVFASQGKFDVSSVSNPYMDLLIILFAIIILLFIFFLIAWLIWRERNKEERERFLNTWKGF